MPRESYRPCPECKRKKGVEHRMLFGGGAEEFMLDVVRCTSCQACSIGNVVVRARGRRAWDEPIVRETIAKALRKMAERHRRDAEEHARLARACDEEANALTAPDRTSP